MRDENLDDLLSDDFLDSLGNEPKGESTGEPIIPDWVPCDEGSTTYKSWKAICDLKAEKSAAIKNNKKPKDQTTKKSLYEINRSEVARVVGKAANNIFYGTGRSKNDLKLFLDEQNRELLELFEKQQEALGKAQPQESTGIRAKRKEEIVKLYQELDEHYKNLQRTTAMEMLDASISRLPLDLQSFLKAKKKVSPRIATITGTKGHN